MTRRPLVLALLLLVLSAFSVTGAQGQVVRWNMADEYPATSIQGEADARFAKEVAERSGTRIQVTNQYDAASGFRSKDMVEAVGRGAVPLGNTYMGALGALDARAGLVRRPAAAAQGRSARRRALLRRRRRRPAADGDADALHADRLRRHHEHGHAERRCLERAGRGSPASRVRGRHHHRG